MLALLSPDLRDYDQFFEVENFFIGKAYYHRKNKRTACAHARLSILDWTQDQQQQQQVDGHGLNVEWQGRETSWQSICMAG